MNPFLKKMGFSAKDRVLITHIDDMGFCHAANAASLTCLREGSASCASVIVNAPWFLEAAGYCVDYPALDIGVHLTLTSEYPTYRWPALSSREPATGLMDNQGYLWRTREDAVRHVTYEAALCEMRAQIDAALAAGIKPTHIDTHMGSVVHPKFLAGYLSLAREYGLAAFLPNITKDRLEMVAPGNMSDDYLTILDGVNKGDIPTLDDIMINTLLPMSDKSAFYRDLIDTVKPGLTHLLFHPAITGDELAAIADTHASRHADYLAFCDTSIRDYIASKGITLIGYRELQQALVA